MTQFTPRKPSPRLPGFAYRGHYAYFVTINTAGRQRELVGDFAETCAGTLLESAAKSSFEVMAYCLMPDHVHVLIRGTTANADLVKFVKHFKQLTGFAFKKRTGRQLWHRSFHDYVLRGEDDVDDIAAYIFHNPVRAGLVASAAEYAYSGPPERLGALSDRPEGLSLRPEAGCSVPEFLRDQEGA
jgi:REP element-mobilizing transposase RayT